MHSPRMGSIGCILYIHDVVKMQNKEFEKQCFQYTLLTFDSSIQILILLTVSDFKNLSGIRILFILNKVTPFLNIYHFDY